MFFLLTNYLDDFLSATWMINECNKLTTLYLSVCKDQKFLMALHKTFWASLRLIFLRILLDGKSYLCIPEKKHIKALNMAQNMAHKKKALIKELKIDWNT